MWAQFAELGLLGLPFSRGRWRLRRRPGRDRASSWKLSDAALVVEPYLATVVMGGGLLRHAASAEQRARLIPAIAAGERTLAYAQVERQSRYSLNDVVTRAEPAGAGWRLDRGQEPGAAR